jgi:hypothetical protein
VEAGIGRTTSFAEGGVTFTHALTLWPGGLPKAREAALEAHERFQREEPLLDFTEWQKKRKEVMRRKEGRR